MASGTPGTNFGAYIPGLSSGAAITQYTIVKFASTANAVVAVTATTSVAIGVVQDEAAAAGTPVLVQSYGIATCIAGVNDLAAGENVGFDTTGRVVDHVTETRQSIGRALDASTAIGDYVRVALYGGGSYDGVGA